MHKKMFWRLESHSYWGQYAKAINEAAACVQLNDSRFSDHSGSIYMATQQDVYALSNRTTAEWEELMRRGVIHNIPSEYHEGVHSVLLVDSIAEWNSGLADSFTITTSGCCNKPNTQSGLKKRAAGSDRLWLYFVKTLACLNALNGFADFAGHCENASQVFNKVVSYLSQEPKSQYVSLSTMAPTVTIESHRSE